MPKEKRDAFFGKRADGNLLVKSQAAAINSSMAPRTDPPLSSSPLSLPQPSSSSSQSRTSSTQHTAQKGRLSLSELCNPTSPKPTPLSMSSPEAGPSSPRTIPQKSLAIHPEDENVLIALSALDDMRSGSRPSVSSTRSVARSTSPAASEYTPALTAASTSSTPSVAPKSPQQASDEDAAAAATADFVSRVSGLPIVTTALRAYEQSKASSRVVKYGAEMVESSMKSISRPVIDRLPVNQLDEFACRQLDRFGRYAGTGTSPEHREGTSSFEGSSRPMKDEQHTQNDFEAKQPRVKLKADGSDQSEGQLRDEIISASEESITLPAQDVANRSRWHSLLYEAGGISAAVSEESMRKLKYCLHWLQYATEHIDGQILVLRDFVASLNAQRDSGDERPISASHLQTLTNVKRDVVNTIRQVVDVVSKYAGGALPEPARSRVREFILNLPQRWASAAPRQIRGPPIAHQPGLNGRRRRNGTESRPGSAASTAPSSPLLTPRTLNNGAASNHISNYTQAGPHRQTTASRPTAGSATQAAQRILTLATESLDMMRSVTGVFKESLDRADTWVDRLRTVGIQRQHSSDIPLLEAFEAAPSQHSRHSSVESQTTKSNLVSSSDTATTSYTSFPPSPRSTFTDVPSPGAYPTASLEALRISSLSASAAGSAFATPRSSTQSLPDLAGYNWEYTRRKLQTIHDVNTRARLREEDEDIDEMDEQSAVTALNALRNAPLSGSGSLMDIDRSK